MSYFTNSHTGKPEYTIAKCMKAMTSKEHTESAIGELIEYHVTEALKAAVDKGEVARSYKHPFLGPKTVVAKESILTAYPLQNIK